MVESEDVTIAKMFSLNPFEGEGLVWVVTGSAEHSEAPTDLDYLLLRPNEPPTHLSIRLDEGVAEGLVVDVLSVL